MFSLLISDTLWSVVVRSLWVSGLACVFGCMIGIPLGGWLGVSRFKGRRIALATLNTYLAIPSVIIGLLTYLMLSRAGPLGFLGWLFTIPAMVTAQTLLVIPVAGAFTRQLIEDAETEHGEQFQAMGAHTTLRAALHLFDLRFALVTIALACFSRAIAEVGAVMVVGGNIEGFTRVMTTSIALETSKGDLQMALALGFVLLSVVLCLHLLLSWLQPVSNKSSLTMQVNK